MFVVWRLHQKWRSATWASGTLEGRLPLRWPWRYYAPRAYLVTRWRWLTSISSTMESKVHLHLNALMWGQQLLVCQILLLVLPNLEQSIPYVFIVGQPWFDWLRCLTNNFEVINSNFIDTCIVCELLIKKLINFC